MKKLGGKSWFAFTVIFAFISVISFFQVNSWWADQHHFNMWWKVIGCATGVIAIFCLVKTAQNSSGGNGRTTR